MGESLEDLSRHVRARVAEVHRRAERLSPLDISERMDAIGELADNVCASRASCSDQLLLLPGCRVEMRQAA